MLCFLARMGGSRKGGSVIGRRADVGGGFRGNPSRLRGNACDFRRNFRFPREASGFRGDPGNSLACS